MDRNNAVAQKLVERLASSRFDITGNDSKPPDLEPMGSAADDDSADDDGEGDDDDDDDDIDDFDTGRKVMVSRPEHAGVSNSTSVHEVNLAATTSTTRWVSLATALHTVATWHACQTISVLVISWMVAVVSEHFEKNMSGSLGNVLSQMTLHYIFCDVNTYEVRLQFYFLG